MIFLPLALGDYVASGQRTPFELRKFLSCLVLQADSLIDEADAKLVYDWCTAATQASTRGNSLLTINMDTLSNTEAVFAKWKADRVDSTLGKMKTPPPLVQPTALPATQPATAQTINARRWARTTTKHRDESTRNVDDDGSNSWPVHNHGNETDGGSDINSCKEEES